MADASHPSFLRVRWLRRPVTICLALLLGSYVGWDFGGGWLWRTIVPPSQPVRLRLIFSNETHGPVTLTEIKVGMKAYITRVDVPEIEAGNRTFLDLPQAGYVEPIEVRYRFGIEATSHEVTFTADARFKGECGLEVFIASTAHASTCGAVNPDGFVSWDSWMFGPPRSDEQP